MLKGKIKYLLFTMILFHLCLSTFFVAIWFAGMWRSFWFYRDFADEDKIFTTSIQEYLCIQQIRKEIPEDARILWLPKVSGVVNYYLYPRKIYRDRDYQPGEEVKIDKEFIKDRKINYVFVDYGEIYRIEEVAGALK